MMRSPSASGTRPSNGRRLAKLAGSSATITDNATCKGRRFSRPYAVTTMALCSIAGLWALSGNIGISSSNSSSSGSLSSYFSGSSTNKGGRTTTAAGLVARFLLAAEKHEVDEHEVVEVESNKVVESSTSSNSTSPSSAGERQMLKIDVSAGGGSDGTDSSASSSALPAATDLANAAPVYLDEIPQCAGLTASQCEDLLSAHPEILQETSLLRPSAGQMADSRYSSMQGAYGTTASGSGSTSSTSFNGGANFASSSAAGANSMMSATTASGSNGNLEKTEYWSNRDVEHGTTKESKATLHFKDPVVHKATERQITDAQYYKVVLVTDREKTKVVGPEGFGEVTYPFPWRYKGERISVGPWDCQPAGEVLSVDQCCHKITSSVPCPDDLGNCMSCHIQPGYVRGHDKVYTQPNTLNVDTYNEFHYDDVSSSNGDTTMAESTVFGSNFAGPNFAPPQQQDGPSFAPPQDASSSTPPYASQQHQTPPNAFPSHSAQNGMMPGSPGGAFPMAPGNYYQSSTRGGTSHHVPGGFYDPKTGRYYASTTIGNGGGMASFPNAGGGGSGSDGSSIHVLVEDGDDDGNGGGSGGPSAWTILTFVLLILASFFIGFLVNYGLRKAKKRRKRVIITDDPTALNGGTFVPPGAVSIAPSVANADMDVESMGGGRYPIAFQPRRRGRRDSLSGSSMAYTARSAPVQYVFDEDSDDDDDDIEVVSTAGRNYFPPNMMADPPAHMYVDHPSIKPPRFPHRNQMSSAASNILEESHNNSTASNLTSSFRSSFRTRSARDENERETDQSSVDTSVRANSIRRVRRNSL